MGSSIVFVDWRVADIDSLLAGLPAGDEVVILDGASDGLDQIAARLQGRSGLDAIHIISHGSSGSVWVGTIVIDKAAFAAHASQLETIGRSLTETDDILLYGCNLAQGETGIQFLTFLAQATGADVAADANDILIYNSSSGALYYDADGTGAAAAVQFATLGAGRALTAGDFVVS